eukprot:TRINITY_DN35229_c0_g1_i1.p1 TRINITY_DN35229_c0_g1~~TRINITY_DN35229_c0_g1_i1.p1  ORF type:complete len:249 (+),score=26.92 TRINITY_DN35229_c0_g1_i1:59-805(+)
MSTPRRRVLCFGDSNTFGTHAARPGYRIENRWPLVMARELGCDIIEEGCGGRTTSVDDPHVPHKNGLTYLPPCLHSHRPLDLVIIMLGTNDLKHHLDRSAAEIADSILNLAVTVRTRDPPCGPGAPAYFPTASNPPVLVVVPPGVRIASLPADHRFVTVMAGAEDKMAALPLAVARAAAALADPAVRAVNAGPSPSGGSDVPADLPSLGMVAHEADGVHLDDASHEALGVFVAKHAAVLLAGAVPEAQ